MIKKLFTCCIILMIAYLPGAEKAIEAVKAQQKKSSPSKPELEKMRDFFEGSMRRNQYYSDTERKKLLK